MSDFSTCPECGQALKSEKTSLSGEVIRTWLCFACHWSIEVNEGMSLGTAMGRLNQPERTNQGAPHETEK